MTIRPHPHAPRHWYLGNILIAGADTAEAAQALLEAQSNGAADATTVTADEVRLEASRRMQALVGARDASHLERMIANATREAVRLLRKGEASWSEAEAQRAHDLEAQDRAIEAIRAASNALEQRRPFDYQDDLYWPISNPHVSMSPEPQ